jgi:prolyl-tRNA editing enzyme YbaK/EbsC (Cys-tRNA(Pro) deacylase)
MVVRRGEGDYLLVLVPGDRVIGWPKLRALLNVSRLSMPDADEAFDVTGFQRGTITPIGTKTPLPVIADERIRGRIVTLGAGEHNTAIAVDADPLLSALGAQVADVTDSA